MGHTRFGPGKQIIFNNFWNFYKKKETGPDQVYQAPCTPTAHAIIARNILSFKEAISF